MTKLHSRVTAVLIVVVFTMYFYAMLFGNIIKPLGISAEAINNITYGDLDNDNTISAFDLTIAKKMLLEQTENAEFVFDKSADVNGDTLFNVSDVEEIQRYINGNADNFNAYTMDSIKAVEIPPMNTKYDNDYVIFGWDRSKTQIPVSELYNKLITIYYKPGLYNEETFSFFNSKLNYNSIFNLPDNMYSEPLTIIPILRIGDKEYKSGEVQIATFQKFTFTLFTQGKQIDYSLNVLSGEMFSLVFNFGTMSQGEMNYAYTDFLETAQATNNAQNLSVNTALSQLNEKNIYSPDYLGKLLRFIGTSYFYQSDALKADLGKEYGITEDNPIRVARFGYQQQVIERIQSEEILDRTLQKQGYFYCDIFGDRTKPISTEDNNADLQAYQLTAGYLNSALEHTVIEQICGIDSLSTAKIFEKATEEEIEIVTISNNSETDVTDFISSLDTAEANLPVEPNNLHFASDISQLNIENNTKTLVQQYLDQGYIVTIPKQEITINDWTGTGLIVSAPDGFSHTFLTYGKYNGGDFSAYYGGAGSFFVNLCFIVSIAIEVVFFVGAVATIGAATSLAAAVPGLIWMGFSYAEILRQSMTYYDYISESTEAVSQSIMITAAISVCFNVIPGAAKTFGKACKNFANHTILSAKYGKSTIQNLENAGSNIDDIYKTIKSLQKAKVAETTIKNALKNTNIISYNSRILNSVSKLGANGADDFVKAVARQSSDDVLKVLSKLANENVDEVAELIAKNGYEYAKNISIIPKIYADAADDVVMPLYRAAARQTTRAADNVADEVILSKAKSFRESLPTSTLRRDGNVGIAEVNIDGIESNLFAHSRIKELSEISEEVKNVYKVCEEPINPIFKAIEAPLGGGKNFFLRDIDTEYKILNSVAKDLGDNFTAKGTISLFTERPPCDSCENVIIQFLEKFPNINIDVIYIKK